MYHLYVYFQLDDPSSSIVAVFSHVFQKRNCAPRISCNSMQLCSWLSSKPWLIDDHEYQRVPMSLINQRNGKIFTERWVSETKNVKDGFSIIIIHQNCTLYESNVFNCGNCNFSSYRMIFSAGRPSASEAAGEDWTLPGRAVCHCSMYCILVEDGKSWCKMRNLLQVVADHHTTLV